MFFLLVSCATPLATPAAIPVRSAPAAIPVRSAPAAIPARSAPAARLPHLDFDPRDGSAIRVDDWLQIDLASGHAHLIGQAHHEYMWWARHLPVVDAGDVPDVSYMLRGGGRAVWLGGVAHDAVCVADELGAAPRCYQIPADPRPDLQAEEQGVLALLAAPRPVYWLSGDACTRWQIEPVTRGGEEWEAHADLIFRRDDDFSYRVGVEGDMLVFYDRCGSHGGPARPLGTDALVIPGGVLYLDEATCLGGLRDAVLDRLTLSEGPC